MSAQTCPTSPRSAYAVSGVAVCEGPSGEGGCSAAESWVEEGKSDLTRFARLDELGLEVTGQRVTVDRAVLACRVVEPDTWCRRCGCEGAPRDTVTRGLAHEPLGWRPTTLLVTIRRYRCTGCGHVWRQDTSKAAEPRPSCHGVGCAGRWKGWSSPT